MKNSQIRLVVVLGVVAILGIIAVQTYWLRKAYDIKQRQINESIHIALQEVAENMANISETQLPNQDVVRQVSNNYFVVDINDVLDANTLEYYLKNEFSKYQINLNFEYAIYDCRSDKMVYGSYVNVEDNSNIQKTVNLPTYDEYIYYFGVYFPTKEYFIVNNMRLGIFFSVILLIAVVFFAYAIYVILQQKRLSELQTDFINNMTHEFKTPISSIALSSEAMLKNKEFQKDARMHKYAEIIKNQTERLNQQVEKVLQIAKLEGNTLKLNKENFDLVALLHDVAQSVSLNFEKKGGSIKVQSNVDSYIVNADKTHVSNILYNLLDNSLKYNDKKPEVFILFNKTENETCLCVQDNGLGIDKKYIDQLFDKFFRVPTGDVHNIKGFGLGLFYVKQVVREHAWKISVESELNKGTTFKICL